MKRRQAKQFVVVVGRFDQQVSQLHATFVRRAEKVPQRRLVHRFDLPLGVLPPADELRRRRPAVWVRVLVEALVVERTDAAAVLKMHARLFAATKHGQRSQIDRIVSFFKRTEIYLH